MRSLASGASTALASPAVDLAVLVEMAFSPVLYLATSAVPIVWGGNTYLAAGSLGAIEDLRDSAGDSQGVKFAISGIPTENIALVLGTSARNTRCILRPPILNAHTQASEDVSTPGTSVPARSDEHQRGRRHQHDQRHGSPHGARVRPAQAAALHRWRPAVGEPR